MLRFKVIGLLGLAAVMLLAGGGTSQEVKKPDKEEADPVEVQTRGPLHEAYAQPFDPQPGPGPMVPKEPPAPIPEDAPEQRPDAEDAQWYPGYWAWDAQRGEHMWVSGVYRVPPTNRKFIPGYWSQTPDGWRWINGFWSNPQQPDVPYTPEPPASLDNGPQLPAPDTNSMYITGVWVYRDSRFVWRPGYWAPIQEGRVWNPPHYTWTPNGYLYCDGFWDWPFDARGLIFAPVYFHRPLWLNAGWRYRPTFVVGFNSFFDSAFIGFGGGYCFGNYYDPFYARAGYRPWYNGGGRYDPVFAYHGWQNHRNNPNWVQAAENVYVQRSAGKAVAPPATFAQQRNLVAAKTAPAVVTPLEQFSGGSMRLVKPTETQIKVQQAAVQQTRDIAVNRQVVESASAAAAPRSSQVRTLPLSALIDARPKDGPTVNPSSPLPKTDPTPLSRPLTPAAPKSTGPGIGGPKSTDSNPRPNADFPKSSIVDKVPPTVVPVKPLPNATNPPPKATITQPKIINTLPPAPTVTNTLPKGPSVTNSLPKGPSVTNTLPKATLPPAGVTNNPQVAPRIIPSSPPPVAPRVTTPAPAPRITAPAPAPRFTPAPAPRVTPPPVRSSPPPRPAPSVGRKK